MLYNNVSRELFKDGVMVVPVLFKKQWLIWKDRKAGGGFRGAFDTKDEAVLAVQDLVESGEVGAMDIVDTAQNLCLVLHPDGKVSEIAISMSKSKMKVSRQWNSMIRLNGGDRFSRVYQLTAVEQENSAGETFFNYHIVSLGFPSEKVYKAAEALYEDMKGSRSFTVNHDNDEVEPDGQSSGEF
jgi:hypothetical protein